LTLNFIGSGLEHFSEVIAERMTLLEVLAARFNNDSRIIAKRSSRIVVNAESRS
jgi:hypothetical protein